MQGVRVYRGTYPRFTGASPEGAQKMGVNHTARAERLMFSGHRCEANGLHHPDCPGVFDGYSHRNFVLHHIWRRQDPVPHNVHRDDVAWLRIVWNGPTGMGAAGCHGRIHRNQPEARRLGLLAPHPTHTLTLTPHGWLTSTNLLIGTT